MGTRTDASKLFDLFRTREEFPVLDQDGHEVMTVTLQALDWQQNNALTRLLEQSRFRVRAEMVKNNQRQQIEDSLTSLGLDQLVDFIVGVERPTATAVADLAPNGVNEESMAAQKKEEEAIQRWEEARRKELSTLDLPELREIVVRRQEALYVQARSVQDYVNESLCLMIINPDTGNPVFSTDPEAPNFIGKLMPEVLNQFLKFRQDFLAKRAEKTVRKAAEDPAFLLSGESPKAEGDSPGETTETPRRSPRSRSVSTAAVAG